MQLHEMQVATALFWARLGTASRQRHDMCFHVHIHDTLNEYGTGIAEACYLPAAFGHSQRSGCMVWFQTGKEGSEPGGRINVHAGKHEVSWSLQ